MAKQKEVKAEAFMGAPITDHEQLKGMRQDIVIEMANVAVGQGVFGSRTGRLVELKTRLDCLNQALWYLDPANQGKEEQK